MPTEYPDEQVQLSAHAIWKPKLLSCSVFGMRQIQIKELKTPGKYYAATLVILLGKNNYVTNEKFYIYKLKD